MPTNKELEIAYSYKKSLREDLFEIAEEVLAAQADLKRLKAHIISTTDKKVLGSNDKEREAYIVSHTIEEANKLEALEAEKRALDLEYSLACDTIDLLQWQIRNNQIKALNSGREATNPQIDKKIIEEYGCSLKEHNQAEDNNED